jgi:hypothetical protein
MDKIRCGQGIYVYDVAKVFISRVRLWLEYKMRYVVIHKAMWYRRIQGHNKVYVWNMLWYLITVRASFLWWWYFCFQTVGGLI